MAKIIKNNLGNFLVIYLIFLIVVGWIFSGLPQIWQNPPFPPGIEEVQADPDTERQSPDAYITQTNLDGTIADIQDDPDSPDANWADAIDTGAHTLAHVSFPPPTGNPTTGAGLQKFKIWVKKAGGSSTPSVRVDLYENGIELANGVITATSVTSTTGVLLSGTWDATLLTNADGSGVEAYVDGINSLGKPTNRAAISVGAVEWNVDYTTVVAPTLSFSITNNDVGFGTWPNTNKRWANSAKSGAEADPGVGEATQLGASTNSSSGLIITVRSQGNGATAGLYKSSGTTHLIEAVEPSSVANATEGYAIYGANASLLTVVAGFAIGGTTVLATSAQTFASASGTVDGGTVDVKPIAGITSTTPAGSYADTLTFICTGTF